MKIISFKSSSAFRAWLKKNGSKSDGIWLRFYKKSSNLPTIRYPEALDQALCFGWIDGQRKAYDAQSYINKFTPRRKNSLWSKRNTINVKRLIKSRAMTDAGLNEIKAAKKDGRWAAAYDSPKNSSVPKDFLNILSKHKTAFRFFKSLSNANIYAITFRLQTARTKEIRERRIAAILAMLLQQKAFHP